MEAGLLSSALPPLLTLKHPWGSRTDWQRSSFHEPTHCTIAGLQDPHPHRAVLPASQGDGPTALRGLLFCSCPVEQHSAFHA